MMATAALLQKIQHILWWTICGPELAYELGELAEWVDLDRFKAKQGVKVAEVGLGRNITRV